MATMTDILAGSWHLIHSTFPMWRKAGINNVTFNYSIAEKDGVKGLLDDVKYLRYDDHRSLKGYDKPKENDQAAFNWRGKGLLMIASSEWRVDWLNQNKNCAVISFSKSLFSPAGVDIICRSKYPPATDILAAMEYINSHSDLREKAANLFKVP
jgi:hypothetical protein